MAISNFPASLQPIIQQNMLERELQQAIRSRLGYRAIADRESIPMRIGETITKTRAGLKGTAKTPISPSSNTNLDNGLTSASYGVEQYTLSMNMYGDTIDLNMVTTQVGIVGQFLQNAYVNGEQAARTLDELARDALFNVYLGGNTRVVTTLGAPGQTIAVDDIRGFQTVWVNGQPTAVSNSNFLTVTVNGAAHNIGTVTADGSNVSTAPNGISGTLTTVSGNITIANGTAGNAVVSGIAPSIVRPNSRTATTALTSSDLLTMAALLDAKAKLDMNNVPRIGGFYNCYLDPMSARQLFADADFKQLFTGATAEVAAFKNGAPLDNPFLGLRFIQTTETYSQTGIAGVPVVRRPIVVGQGALVEGDFAGQAHADVADSDAVVSEADGITMVTRPPMDRLKQIIAQSWYWMGGFAAPSDTTAKPANLPTASNAAFKRAVVIEHYSAA